jgi:hypothetical protein
LEHVVANPLTVKHAEHARLLNDRL